MFTTICKSYIRYDNIRIISKIYHNTSVRDVEGEKGIKSSRGLRKDALWDTKDSLFLELISNYTSENWLCSELTTHPGCTPPTAP